jgi:hypothetical protein
MSEIEKEKNSLRDQQICEVSETDNKFKDNYIIFKIMDKILSG